MRLSKLDGFQRVNTSNVVVNGGRQLTKRQAKKRSRQIYIKGDKTMETEVLNAVKFMTAEEQQPWVKSHKQSHKIKSKYAMGQIQTQSTESALSQAVSSGSEPSIGFSRVYVGNDPRMQGFGRIKYTNKELQGLSMQGFEILQGYAMGDADDLEDWNYLLSIEHPDTLQGFPDWVLNGKKERKARQEARRKKRAAQKAARQQKKTTRQTGRQTTRQEKKQRRGAGKERRQRRKEVRTARKEERLRLKTLKKEERQKRKQQRLDDRKQRQLERQETKRLKQEERSRRREARGEQFREGAGDILSTAQDLFVGRDDFGDFSYQDFTPDQLPFGLEDQIDMFRSMPSEQALTYRDQEDIIIDEPLEEAEMPVLDPADAEAPPKKGNTMILLAGAAAIAIAMSQKKKKKRA